ncbi:Bug family tripartite tricarboxylate transporter substrate binding protein [Rhodopseudomonas palustris]|uniref:Tripartite tricarboxylate transporter substrate binding protein n=1 Tax=Rhodopseudomonas palustris TaxID=1076 RepID=A0A418VLS7_RHOPL|nr:tripartite tricarboxylate transporter substrate binding protein [Rhodopseudomonas palustris]RJF77116.1 tripartite tricarboxylate transporter substrate binding protein [Rhodopseudomonas palustris]
MPSSTRPPFRPSRRSLLRGVAALGALPLLPGVVRADTSWPSRPVKFVVPFAAGGTTDILARLVAQQMSEEYGQQFIVENKAGAGGNIAAEFVAKSEPDGYTFIVGTPGTHAINQFVFKTLAYDQVKDIAPVIIIAKVPNLFSVTNSLPVKSVAELIAYAKSKPGELFYGTPGLGSTAHVSTELFKSMTGVQMTHVPYKGSAPMLTDLIAGRVHLTIDNLPASQPHADAGSIRAIAVSTATRWPLLPDLPTIAEAGAPGYDAAAWFTIGAPAKTSPEVIAKLNASVEKFIKTEDGTARLRKLGADPVGGSPDDMQRYVQSEIDKWGKVAKFAKIEPQ